MQPKNETGNTYNRLTIIERAGSKGGKAYWLCRCTCGVVKTVSGDHLRRGKIKSCGCLNSELIRKLGRQTTHGLTNHRLFQTWVGIIARCYNEDAISYPNYGARGITVCDEWRYSPEKFIKWAEILFEEGLVMDRIDNNKGYSPENCRFANRSQSSINRRTAGGSGGYRGVYKKRSKFCASIQHNGFREGKLTHIGNFSTAIEAATARDEFIDKFNLPNIKSLKEVKR